MTNAAISEGWIRTTLGELVNSGDFSMKNNLRKPIASNVRASMQGIYPYYGAASAIDYLDHYSVEGYHLLMAEDGTVTIDGKHPMLQLVDGLFNVSNHAHIIQGKTKIKTKLLYYILSSIDISAFVTGAVQPKLSKENLFKISFMYPPEDIGINIVNILSSFDDKINLLKEENELLEKIGESIFKELVGKYKIENELPNGWKLGKLGDIIEFIIDNRGKTPLTSDKGDYPMVEINSIIGNSMIININNCKKFVDKELYNTWFRKGHPKRGDVLFSTVGSIGEIAFVFDEVFCIAQNIVGLRSKYGKYMYLLLKSIQGNLKALDISSVQPSIKLPHLLDYDVIIPNENIIKDLEDILNPLFEKINNNGKEINTLTLTRDQLLSKLMSGEMKVLS